jgi:hypothetical protein
LAEGRFFCIGGAAQACATTLFVHASVIGIADKKNLGVFIEHYFNVAVTLKGKKRRSGPPSGAIFIEKRYWLQ